ncbi:MAG TPA: SLBB domain-containing protein [Edaphobacter sp.]|nr:SLBB domain-containing protein [Edaphobacter sp.]
MRFLRLLGGWPLALLIFSFLLVGSGVGYGQSTQQPDLFPNQYGNQGQLPLFPQVFPSTVPQSGAVYSGSALPTSLPSTTGDVNSPELTNSSDNYESMRNMTTQVQRIQQESLRNQERLTGNQAGKAPLTDFQQMVVATTGRTLPIFGASIFSGALPSTFAPAADITVTPDYIIGPGDELRLQVWGQVNLRGAYAVDRTGSISLPGVGAVHVAGLRFDQVTDFLRSKLATIYRNFDLNVNMGQLRSIQVFVVGQARMPGSYSISSLSTLLNALFASGGPLPQGSLRNIQLKRGGKTIVHFDLYDLLLHGDKSNDVQLAQGDVIFIPPVGAQIAVAGSVHNPAIYELKGETTLQQALQLAGGRTSIAVDSQARIERIDDHSSRSIMEVSLQQPGAFQLQDGDVITINAIVDRFKNAVTLRGNVANPGRYVWHPGMRISNLIPNKDSLITRRYWQRQNDLGQMQLNYDPEVKRNAHGFVQPVNPPSSTTSAEAMQDQGNAQAPMATPQGQLVAPASNVPPPNQPANTPPVNASTSTGGNSVGAALAEGIHRFPVRTDVTLSAPNIDWSYAVIERQSSRDLSTSLIPFNLGKLVLDGDQSQNLELMPGDVVTIFSTADIRVPTSEQTRFVRLEGEFVSAGVYSVAPGETLRHLLQRAGGFTPDAYLYASEFTRESTRRVQQQRLNEYADHLETQAAAVSAAGNAAALNAADAAAATAAASAAQAAIAQLRRSHPNGRIVLQLKPDSRGIDSVPDLQLEDGDTFIVPRVPANVSVEGEVYSANAFLYKRGRRTTDYLREAGGPDRQADMKHAFILRADGSVYSQQYGNIKHATIFPGDTIVVPPKLQRTSILRSLVDIATVVGQFGIGVAAINVLK